MYISRTKDTYATFSIFLWKTIISRIINWNLKELCYIVNKNLWYLLLSKVNITFAIHFDYLIKRQHLRGNGRILFSKAGKKYGWSNEKQNYTLALHNNSYNLIVNYLLTFYVCFAGLFTILVLVFELDRHLTGNWSADVFFTYLLILAVTSCLCNPLIYAFKLDIVRRQFRSSILFRCFESCRRVSGWFQ